MDEAGCWKMELAKLKVKALLPVEGAWFSAALALLVGTDGVAPLGGVEDGYAKMSDNRVGGGPSFSGGSSGPLNTVKAGPLWTGGIAGAILTSSSSTSSSLDAGVKPVRLVCFSASFARFLDGRTSCSCSASKRGS